MVDCTEDKSLVLPDSLQDELLPQIYGSYVPVWVLFLCYYLGMVVIKAGSFVHVQGSNEPSLERGTGLWSVH